MDKRRLRRDLLSRARSLSREEREERSAVIRGWLAGDPAFLEAGVVFAFASLPEEPDLSPLFAAYPSKRWVFPRVSEEGRIVFHEIGQFGEGLRSDYGILEPEPGRHPEVPASDAELVLVPGVGFDPETRARLGRGKGYYDRFLAGTLQSPRPALRVGVAFSSQLNAIPVEPHDIAMDRILTDEGWC